MPSPQSAHFDTCARAASLTTKPRKKIEAYIEEDEGATHKLGGPIEVAYCCVGHRRYVISSLCCYCRVLAVSQAPIVPTYLLRPIHVGMMMTLLVPAVSDAEEPAQQRDVA